MYTHTPKRRYPMNGVGYCFSIKPPIEWWDEFVEVGW